MHKVNNSTPVFCVTESHKNKILMAYDTLYKRSRHFILSYLCVLTDVPCNYQSFLCRKHNKLIKIIINLESLVLWQKKIKIKTICNVIDEILIIIIFFFLYQKLMKIL